jgi:hypothetical protein
MVLACFHGDTLSGVMDVLLNSKEHVVGSTLQGTPFCLFALLELLSWKYCSFISGISWICQT